PYKLYIKRVGNEGNVQMLSIRFKRILTSVQAKPIINVLIILVLAFVSSYPAFTGHFFALSNDGAIHLALL
ncbi:hypothetical protein, partial [Lactiplantibacillus plantarum]|uniref:hypothetical protein n=1 Tax=Lactiplantibacillus plantarum TaxID=1590 RepID=UPI001F17122C